jgi:glycolate oxidase
VLADGTILATGGKNRKDVTGYNLTQLLVGSEGTLAVLTGALLRLAVRPAASLTAGLVFADLEAAARGVVALFAAGLDPAACEIVERRGLELVGALEPLPAQLADAGALLLVAFDGPETEPLLQAVAALAACVGGEALGEPMVALDDRDQRRLWQVRRLVGEAVKQRSPYKEVDAVVPRAHLAQLARSARSIARQHGLEAVSYGHAGDGNLHVNLLRGELEEAAWQHARDGAEDQLVEAVLALGGALTGEHGVGWTQRRHLTRALGSAAVDLQRRLKQAFDPLGILNPGKVLPDAAAASG